MGPFYRDVQLNIEIDRLEISIYFMTFEFDEIEGNNGNGNGSETVGDATATGDGDGDGTAIGIGISKIALKTLDEQRLKSQNIGEKKST